MNTPIISPLLALLRSRKVIVSVIVFLVAILVQAIPALVPVAGTLTSVLAIFGVAVISGISIEDAAKYVGERGYPPVVPTDPQLTPEEALRKLINDAIDEKVNPAALMVSSPKVVAPAKDFYVETN